MMRIKFLVICGALLLTFCVRAEAQDANSQASQDPDWEFNVSPYFFLASLDGTIGAVGQRAEVNARFRDLLGAKFKL